MKIHYLGTGAAEGIPSLFCNCEYCSEARRQGGKMVRSRSQVVIDRELSIDFSPDCFYHGAFLNVDLSAIRYLLFTHSHMDHTYAHDFILRGYKYARDLTSPDLYIYGNEEVLEVYKESVRREMKESVGSHIFLNEVRAFEPFSFGAWSATPLKANHSSQNPLLYLLEKDGKRVLHLCDTGLLPEEDYDFLQKLGKTVDLITIDCNFLYDSQVTKSWRHMDLQDNAAVFEKLTQIGVCTKNTKKVITHFSHNSRPSPTLMKRAEEEYGVIAAYDGLVVEI